MKLINRSAFIVRLREPYIRWASNVDDKASEHAQILHKSISVYLALEDPSEENETPSINEYFKEIIEHQIEAWCTDESFWPKDRSLSAFSKWFEVTGQSLVWDIGVGKIEKV